MEDGVSWQDVSVAMKYISRPRKSRLHGPDAQELPGAWDDQHAAAAGGGAGDDGGVGVHFIDDAGTQPAAEAIAGLRRIGDAGGQAVVVAAVGLMLWTYSKKLL